MKNVSFWGGPPKKKHTHPVGGLLPEAAVPRRAEGDGEDETSKEALRWLEEVLGEEGRGRLPRGQ